MSEQLLNNSVVDSVNVARTVEEKPDGNTSSIGRDLKQPVAGVSLDLVIDPKKKGFHITSTVELDGDDSDVVEEPGRGFVDQPQQSAEGAAVAEQNNLSKSDGISSGVQPKKKISFQVTSIQSKEGRRRGDSNDDEELNESELVEEDEGESPDSTLSHATGNGNSRFKVVKIPRYDSKMYTRGRWGCWDFVQPPPSAVPYLNEIPGYKLDLSEKTDSDTSIVGKNSVVSNASAGAISKGAESNLELLSHVQQTSSVAGETPIYEEKNPIVKNDAVVSCGPQRNDERGDLSINNSSGLGKNSDNQPTQYEEDDAKIRLDLSEDELVAKKIEKAMNQVVQIKADLLQNVNADVKKLKQTIQQLTHENQRLKEENELLKQQMSTLTKPEPI